MKTINAPTQTTPPTLHTDKTIGMPREKGIFENMLDLAKTIQQAHNDNPEMAYSILGGGAVELAKEIMEQYEKMNKQ